MKTSELVTVATFPSIVEAQVVQPGGVSSP